MTTIIIPAAGYGLRVKSALQPGQSKELLVYEGKPLIDRALELCQQLKTPHQVVVVTRPEKLDLVQYLESQKVKTYFLPPTKEWTETILKTEKLWTDWSVVLLPDVDFSPLSALSEIAAGENQQLSWKVAGFFTDEPQKWGVIKSSNLSYLEIAEKPSIDERSLAWGILGFSKEFGKSLWPKMVESSFDHEFKKVDGEGCIVNLELFRDLTRG